MESTERSCLCIIGWHYSSLLYEQLQNIENIDVYVLSHRLPGEIPEALLTTRNIKKFLPSKNVGYDWGAYQQFIDTNIYLDYPYVFFAHDDVTILDYDVFSICIEKLHENQNYCMIGNGRQSYKRDWPKTHIHSYAHSRWKPPGWDFEHDTVRGSFWATSRKVINQLNPLEVLWDHKKIIGIGAGNWSLRATCGKAQSLIGDRSFVFLSDTYLTSPYLVEFERGKQTPTRKTPPLSWRMMNKLLVFLSSRLMTVYMNTQSKPVRKTCNQLMKGLFRVI
jgi:hypothetical protein